MPVKYSGWDLWSLAMYWQTASATSAGSIVRFVWDSAIGRIVNPLPLARFGFR